MKPDLGSNKVLITGINGFTGIHLEKHLKSHGFDVYGTVLEVPEHTNHFQCNLVNQNEIDNIIKALKPDYVVHIAAISFVGESNASLIYNVNVIGTENLLNALITHKSGLQKVILSSSATIYGNQGQSVLEETMCPMPVNHYGISKLSMEYVAKNYFDRLPILISRPFNYTGIGQENHFLIPKIIKHFAQKSTIIELGNLHVAREFNDIESVIDIYYRLLISCHRSEIVNIASNAPVKLLDIISMMNEIAGYKIDVHVNPDFVRKNEIASLSGSTKKLASLIGEVNYVPIKETLRKMYIYAHNEENENT